MFRKIWDWFAPVKVGQLWRRRNKHPFHEENFVTILELKNGWVKYEDGDQLYAQEVPSFLYFYRKKGS